MLLSRFPGGTHGQLTSSHYHMLKQDLWLSHDKKVDQTTISSMHVED